jgi:hypothetical protein
MLHFTLDITIDTNVATIIIVDKSTGFEANVVLKNYTKVDESFNSIMPIINGALQNLNAVNPK